MYEIRQNIHVFRIIIFDFIKIGWSKTHCIDHVWEYFPHKALTAKHLNEINDLLVFKFDDCYFYVSFNWWCVYNGELYMNIHKNVIIQNIHIQNASAYGFWDYQVYIWIKPTPMLRSCSKLMMKSKIRKFTQMQL